MATYIKIKQVKSTIARAEKFEKILIGLGLRKTGKVSILKDTPEIRGMIRKVSHLVEIEPCETEME
ncbi:50S ribosomal protein L30 [Myxococcota bacterium]|nr:50S ribosomal protein L30 [Myxococcota bacterium]MBU1382614.1 50S ribosomal protein L30 [Myxococcota bacterium]MBU1495831.1 50S ribosomal protein L30 [Myxococcota bacterium]